MIEFINTLGDFASFILNSLQTLFDVVKFVFIDFPVILLSIFYELPLEMKSLITTSLIIVSIFIGFKIIKLIPRL